MASYNFFFSVYVGPGSLYYENFHYMMSKHLYIIVDLHYYADTTSGGGGGGVTRR